MLNRLKAILADFFQQADLVLLSLCCISTLFGIVMIFSATRYLDTNRQRCHAKSGAVPGDLRLYFPVDGRHGNRHQKWKWIAAFNSCSSAFC